MQELESLQDGGSTERAEGPARACALDHACLLLAEDSLRWRGVMERGPAEGDDGVELTLGREVFEVGLPGEAAAIEAGSGVRGQQFRQTGDVLFGNAKEEGVPVGAGRKQVAVGDEHGSDTGAHDLEETDTAGAGAAGTEDEARGGKGAGVALLTVFAAGLVQIPVKISTGVFDEDIGAIEAEIEEAFAEERGAAALEGEEERLLRRLPRGGDEGVRVLAVARDVGVAEGTADAAVAIDLSRAIDAWSEGEIVVVLGIDGAAVGIFEVERMFDESAGLGSEAAGEEDEIRLSRVFGERMLAALRAVTKETDEFALIEGGQVNVHR